MCHNHNATWPDENTRPTSCGFILPLSISCISLIELLYRLRGHCKNMVEGLTKVNNIVAHVMVLRRYAVFVFHFIYCNFYFSIPSPPYAFLPFYNIVACTYSEFSQRSNAVILVKKSGRHIRRKDGPLQILT